MLETDVKHILLYDLNGQMIYNKTIPIGRANYTLPTSGMQNAVYIMKLISSDHMEFTSKISVKN